MTVFDYGVLSTEGAFLVMELVSGEKPFAGKSYHELLAAMSGEIEFDSDARIVKFSGAVWRINRKIALLRQAKCGKV